jgi:hypothetical protein
VSPILKKQLTAAGAVAVIFGGIFGLTTVVGNKGMSPSSVASHLEDVVTERTQATLLDAQCRERGGDFVCTADVAPDPGVGRKLTTVTFDVKYDGDVLTYRARP